MCAVMEVACGEYLQSLSISDLFPPPEGASAVIVDRPVGQAGKPDLLDPGHRLGPREEVNGLLRLVVQCVEVGAGPPRGRAGAVARLVGACRCPDAGPCVREVT